MSDSFKDAGWARRYASMGDEAEAVFEAVYPQGWVRFGLDRPPLRMYDLPAKIRYCPDYLTSKGFVEVQGLGRDRTVKVKHDKLDAMEQWHEEFRCDLFLWDRTKERFGFVRLTDLQDAIAAGKATTEHFPEGKAYFAFNVDDAPVDKWYDRLEKMSTAKARG